MAFGRPHPHTHCVQSPALSTLALLRLIQNLLVMGTVAELDAAAARVRVRLAVNESGDVLTDWRPWISIRAGNVSLWSPPSPGEQCLLLSPGGDLANAIALTGLFSQDRPAPGGAPTLHRMAFADGARVDYDQAAHTLAAVLPEGGTAAIDAPGGITLKGNTVIDGGLRVKDDAQFDKNIEAGGKAVITGEVEAADAKLGPAKLGTLDHIHNTTSPGNPTSPPLPGSV